jgi:hypothetical protein
MKKQAKPNLGFQQARFDKAEKLLSAVERRQKIGWNETAERIAKQQF